MGISGLVGWEWGPEQSLGSVTATLRDLGQPSSLTGCCSLLLTADPRGRQGEDVEMLWKLLGACKNEACGSSLGTVEKPGHGSPSLGL